MILAARERSQEEGGWEVIIEKNCAWLDNNNKPWLYYLVTQKLRQIYTANHAVFQIQIRKIAVQK